LAAEELKINDRVEIRIQNPYYAGKYSSRVEEILPNTIVLAAPLKRGVIVPLRAGDTITVSYYGQTAGYSFTTKVIGASYQKLPLIAVQKPQKVNKIQRRNYIRIPASIPVRFLVLDDQRQPAGSDLYSTETLDISGGGALIISPVKLSRDDCLDIELDLPRRGTIRVLGRVARVEKKKSEYGPRYLIGVDFSVIDKADREKIIQYVFELQREMRRKGLI